MPLLIFCIREMLIAKTNTKVYISGVNKMSNGVGGSKKNRETDANHVSAKDREYQKRMTKIHQQEHNDGRKYNGKI